MVRSAAGIARGQSIAETPVASYVLENMMIVGSLLLQNRVKVLRFWTKEANSAKDRVCYVCHAANLCNTNTSRHIHLIPDTALASGADGFHSPHPFAAWVCC